MTVDELAAVIGDDAAMLFMARQGGQRYSVPKKVSPRLVDHMGEKAAAIFVREYAGAVLFIPTGRPWRAVRLYRGGMSILQISLALCMSAKAVRQIVQRAGKNAEGPANQDRRAA
jgi:hypothetical protein